MFRSVEILWGVGVALGIVAEKLKIFESVSSVQPIFFLNKEITFL